MVAPAVPAAFDHVVYAAPNLDDAIADLAARLGVRAAPGGAHEGLGTHNALLGLGGARYLEILAPVIGPPADSPVAAMLAGLRPSRNFLWAVATDNIAELQQRARATGYDPGEVVDMARALPDGTRLEWRVTMGGDHVIGGVVPFAIQWGGAAHPTGAAPGGCELVAFHAEHPDPGLVRRALSALGVEVRVEEGPAPALVAAIESPNGRVELR